MNVSLGVFGQLTPARTPIDKTTDPYGTVYTQSTQGTSASAGVLGTFHQSFGRWLGYSVNLGYSRLAENNSQGTAYIPNPKDNPPERPYSYFAQGSIGTNMYELTGAYVVEGPRTKRGDMFVQLLIRHRRNAPMRHRRHLSGQSSFRLDQAVFGCCAMRRWRCASVPSSSWAGRPW